MTVSAEGQVENQKLNQTAALLSFGWVFGFQLDLLEKHLITLTRVTFKPELKTEKKHVFSVFWKFSLWKAGNDLTDGEKRSILQVELVFSYFAESPRGVGAAPFFLQIVNHFFTWAEQVHTMAAVTAASTQDQALRRG